MKFRELVRLLEDNGFKLVSQKGSVRYYGKDSWDRLIRVDDHGAKEVPTGTYQSIPGAAGIDLSRGLPRIDLPDSVVIEATEERDFSGFFSPELEGFTGIGHSIEQYLYQARWGMKEHVASLQEQGLPIPPRV